jgi:hypothetical protein
LPDFFHALLVVEVELDEADLRRAAFMLLVELHRGVHPVEQHDLRRARLLGEEGDSPVDGVHTAEIDKGLARSELPHQPTSVLPEVEARP